MLSMAILRNRWGGFVGTFVALALGVGLMATVAQVMLANEARTPERYAAAPVVVHSGGLERPPFSRERADSLAAGLARVPGVSGVVAEHAFYAQPVGTDVVRGRGWSSASLAGQGILVGAVPKSDRQIAVGDELGLGLGSTVTVITARGPSAYQITGLTKGKDIYFSDDLARRSAPGVSVIGLMLAPGADVRAVESAASALVADEGSVLVGEERAALEPQEDANRRSDGTTLLGTMAAIAAFVSIFVVASTFALSVAQRRRELGLLRAVGATPRQVRRMMFGEALGVGAAASSCGALLAIPLTPLLAAMLDRAKLVAQGFSPTIQGWALLAAAVAGLVVALLGVWSASRRAGRVSPLEALREAAVDRKPMTGGRWVFGILLSLLGFGLAFGSAASGPSAVLSAAAFAAMALIAGLTLLAPVIIPSIAHITAWPLARMRGATGLLVRESMLVAVRRTASTAAPVLVTVGFAAVITGVIATFGVAVTEDGVIDARLRGGVVVLPDGTPGLSDAAVAAVGSGEGPLMSRIYARFADGQVSAVEAAGVTAAVFPMGADEIAIAEGYAESLDWKPGDTVEVVFADGERQSLRVKKITDDIDDDALAGGAVLPREVVREHDGNALTDAVFVKDDSAVAVQARVRALNAVAADPETYARARVAREENLIRLVVLVMVGLSLAYTAIAVANTLLMATTARARDFAVLRLSGATARQVATVVAAEAMVVTGIGAVLGFAVALVAVGGVAWALTKDIGVRIPLEMDWPVMGIVFGVCLALALAASVVPARLGMRSGAATRVD